MTENISEKQISVWLDAALENIKDYKFEVTGTSEKGEGYATDVVFVTVEGSEKTSNKSVELNLVLKVGKDFKALANDMEEAYIREMFIYDRVFPEYRNFQRSKNQKNILDCIAKCIKTFHIDRHVIVFDNLRKQGYEAYDRQLPMNIEHIKIVLKNYALFHAIGFAYKDQKKLEFEELTENYTCMYKLMFESTFRAMFQAGAIKTVNSVKEVDKDLASKMKSVIEQGVTEILEKLFSMTVEESVIIHGDCWSSNFLFKYEAANKTCPSNVAILDWQMSSLLSPTVDVAYFMFIVSSKDEVAQFDQLLDYYYDNLCRNITELGSDPDKLYPRSKFLEHWKIFSTVGFLFVTSFLDMVLCDKDDVPELTDCKNSEDLVEMRKNTTAKNSDLYLERIISLSKYYFDLQKR